MALYQIRDTQARGRHMIATQAIGRGICILAETPLIEFDVERRERFDEDAFWSAGKRSGSTQVNKEVGELEEDDIRTYNTLKRHKKSSINLQQENDTGGESLTVAQWDCLSRAHNNAFKREKHVNGNPTVVFTVFSQLSRFNHACKPNAIYQWDDDRDNGRGGRGQGVVHTLDTIANGDEITICYCSDLAFALKSRDDRRAELNETWRFQCGCTACADTSQDALRQTARQLDTALDSVRPPTTKIPGDTHTLGRPLGKHQRLDQELKDMMLFVDHLKALSVNDTRLADAYGRVADYHVGYWEKGDKASTHAHCQTCKTNGFDIVSHPRCHLDQAVAMYQQQIHVLVTCCGHGHEEVRRIRLKRDQLEAVRRECNSPIMT